jgi:hypothetical protein
VAFYGEHKIVSTVDVVLRRSREGPPFGVLEADRSTRRTKRGGGAATVTTPAATSNKPFRGKIQ